MVRAMMFIFAMAVMGCDHAVAPAGDHGTDAGYEPAGGACPGWEDQATGLCWSNPTVEATGGWAAGQAYCTDLGAGWRVPSVGELRTLLRVGEPADAGCAANLPGGACGVTAACAGPACAGDCGACTPVEGPGAYGLYQDAALSAVNFLWADTPVGGEPGAHWLLYLEAGEVLWDLDTAGHVGVRCLYDQEEEVQSDCAAACSAEEVCSAGRWWWSWDGCMEGCGSLPDGAVACVQAVCVRGLAEGEVACDGWVDCIAHCASEEQSQCG